MTQVELFFEKVAFALEKTANKTTQVQRAQRMAASMGGGASLQSPGAARMTVENSGGMFLPTTPVNRAYAVAKANPHATPDPLARSLAGQSPAGIRERYPTYSGGYRGQGARINSSGLARPAQSGADVLRSAGVELPPPRRPLGNI